MESIFSPLPKGLNPPHDLSITVFLLEKTQLVSPPVKPHGLMLLFNLIQWGRKKNICHHLTAKTNNTFESAL